MLSETDQRRFVMLLCLRCSNDDVTLQDNQIAFQLRITPDEWKSSKSLFLQLKLIGEDNKPLNWDKRQFKSDHSGQRVEKHRKRYSNVLDPDQTHKQTQIQTKPEINGFGSFHASMGRGWFAPSLEAAESLRDIAPGWDQHSLIQKYNTWHNGKDTPRNPDKAFLGWAKNFTKGQRPQ